MVSLGGIYAQPGTEAGSGAGSAEVNSTGSDNSVRASEEQATPETIPSISSDGNNQSENGTSADTSAGSPAGVDESTLFLSAPEDPQNNPSSEPEEFQAFGVWDLIRMILVLALVVAMIYGVYYFLKRGKKVGEDESSFISVLSSQTLPGGKQLHIIDVAGQVYLIGAADGAINLITEIQDKVSIDELRLQASRKQVQGANFAQILSGFFSRGQTPAPVVNSAEGQSVADSESIPVPVVEAPGNPAGEFDFVHQQRERLRKL